MSYDLCVIFFLDFSITCYFWLLLWKVKLAFTHKLPSPVLLIYDFLFNCYPVFVVITMNVTLTAESVVHHQHIFFLDNSISPGINYKFVYSHLSLLFVLLIYHQNFWHNYKTPLSRNHRGSSSDSFRLHTRHLQLFLPEVSPLFLSRPAELQDHRMPCALGIPSASPPIGSLTPCITCLPHSEFQLAFLWNISPQ